MCWMELCRQMDLCVSLCAINFSKSIQLISKHTLDVKNLKNAGGKVDKVESLGRLSVFKTDMSQMSKANLHKDTELNVFKI